MKKIQAILQPYKIDEAKQALGDLNVVGMTVSEIVGCGEPGLHSEFFRGHTVLVDTQPRICVEVIVPDDLADKVVMQLRDACRTGRSGDGKLFVLPVDDAVRIRTGDRGDAALT